MANGVRSKEAAVIRQFLAACLLWSLALTLVPERVEARQIPVTDVAHIAMTTAQYIEDILNLLSQYLQYAQMIIDYYNQLEQYYTQLKNLELNEQFVYRFLGRYLVYMQELTQTGGALGYNTPFDTLWRLLEEFFPGIESGMRRIRDYGWKDPYTEGADTTLATLRATLLTASRTKVEVNQGERELDRIQSIARSADGNLEATEATNMLLGHLAHQGGVQMVLLASLINAQNVYHAHQLQEQSQEQVQFWEGTTAWRDGAADLEPADGGSRWHPVIPAGW